ncbi:DUF3127 domain-containing protein [Chryseobacterium sp. RR2-3-20]|uniref:DUF3127 domain-containing protein n=1 Tax=Chryseobacterium sp. RR2-3-20 TaxID=2787626 RepID=UPI001AE0C554|nr:DUF3127 domain-containing protein [Chryseobacterium sp. RR2-3-20]
MQISAKLIQILPLQSGTGKNGEWKKQDIIVETSDKYPKKICISFRGDKIPSQPLIVGINLLIDIDIESREYNGRWYTDVKAWKIQVSGEEKSLETIQNNVVSNSEKDSSSIGIFDDEDDVLPF